MKRPACWIAKPPPRALVKAKRDSSWQAIDEAESDKVRARSGGRCEVTVAGARCLRRGFEVHHHIGGWRRRGRGPSALARNKTHACSKCHGLITSNVLEHLAGNRYRRITV